MPILELTNFSLALGRAESRQVILYGIDLSVGLGQVVGIVGESGSGKSQTALSILGLNSHLEGFKTSGQVCLRHNDSMEELSQWPAHALNRLRNRDIGFVFQQSGEILNPSISIGKQLREKQRLYAEEDPDDSDLLQLLERVGLTPAPRFFDAYPHQLSGGQVQRCLIAMALVNRPLIVIADEPFSALDRSLRTELIELFRDLQETFQFTLILISHNLEVIARLCTHVSVMKAGRIVESGPVQHILTQPQHPYTRELLEAARLTALKDTGSGQSTKNNSSPVVLEMKHIYKAYRKKNDLFADNRKDLAVLKDINVKVHAGRTLGIMGPSGSGKSTLARIMSLLEMPDKGTVYVHGQALTSMTPEALSDLRSEIRIIFQDPLNTMAPHLKIREILEDALPSRISEETLHQIMQEVNLPVTYLEKIPAELSGGERQRVMIAQALLAGPGILICDEILSALDVSSQSRIIDLLKKIKSEREMTMVFISHDETLVRNLSDEIIFLA